MKATLDWLQHNKEWVFSGIGVTGILGVIAVVRWLFRPVTESTQPPSRAPGLQVNLAFGALTYDGPPYVGDQMLIFTVANPGERATQLTGIRVPLENGSNMVFPCLEGEKRLPCMIAPGTNSKFWVNLADVEASMRSRAYSGSAKIHAIASDALGNDYPSNSVTLR